MEKRTPHYQLSNLKQLIRQGSYRATATALSSAAEDFGIVDPPELAACVMALSGEEFYKSMTTLHDSRIWQDVYRSQVEGLRAYIKLQIVDEITVIISFKLL